MKTNETTTTGRGLQRLDRQQAGDRRSNGVFLGVETCARCGGLLTRDEEFSLSIEKKMPSLRCIQCGEWIDELILRNRMTSSRRRTANRRQRVRM
jgi:hypothetical protein